MQKIVLVADATPINNNTLDFACYLAKLTHSKLTGVFLENRVGEPGPALKSLYGTPYVETVVAATIPENKSRAEQCRQNIERFELACKSKGITAYVHRDKGAPLQEVITETRFADLLIIDAKLTLSGENEGVLSAFMKDILTKSECPVVIAPLSFTGIDEIVFAYDGSASSVFAIKQFTYLFPELSDKKLMIIQVNAKEEVPVIEKEQISELLRMHFSAIGYHYLQGKASDELFSHLLGRENIFVVMGAYGRSTLSGFFKPSTADLLVKTVNLPLFIAHH